MAAPRPKAYPSFLVVVMSSTDDTEAHCILKAFNLEAAAKAAATKLEENDFPNFDTWDLDDHPDNYTIHIYELAKDKEVFRVKSAGIVLEKVGD